MRKKVLLLAVVFSIVGLCGLTALALDPMGPPAAGLGKGIWGAGIEWSNSDMTIERQVANWSNNRERIAEIDSLNKVYANLGYGISDNVDLFIRVGMGSTDYDVPGGRQTYTGDGSNRLIFGGGFKATFCEGPGIKWGMLGQYGWGDYHGTQKSVDGRGHFNLQLDELQVAFGPTWMPTNGLAIYGGPFIHFVRGRAEDIHPNGDRLRHAIREEEPIGGYIGAQIAVMENASLNIEWMTTGEADGVGIGLMWKFK